MSAKMKFANATGDEIIELKEDIPSSQASERVKKNNTHGTIPEEEEKSSHPNSFGGKGLSMDGLYNEDMKAGKIKKGGKKTKFKSQKIIEASPVS